LPLVAVKELIPWPSLIVAPTGMLLIVSETRLTGHRGNAAEAAMRCKLRVRNEFGQLIRSPNWFGEQILARRNMARAPWTTWTLRVFFETFKE
jgi:hypothetical protein